MECPGVPPARGYQEEGNVRTAIISDNIILVVNLLKQYIFVAQTAHRNVNIHNPINSPGFPGSFSDQKTNVQNSSTLLACILYSICLYDVRNKNTEAKML